ncbi:hypothetical protein JZU54_04275 [bacterium]|nr:hypothetical protein [bacterium]
MVDGIMLDWWQDDDERLALVKAVRARIGEGALILANANDRAVHQRLLCGVLPHPDSRRLGALVHTVGMRDGDLLRATRWMTCGIRLCPGKRPEK